MGRPDEDEEEEDEEEDDDEEEGAEEEEEEEEENGNISIPAAINILEYCSSKFSIFRTS